MLVRSRRSEDYEDDEGTMLEPKFFCDTEAMALLFPFSFSLGRINICYRTNSDIIFVGRWLAL